MNQIPITLESAYQLIKAKDRRFDGRFYWGVRTTGIYCRPSCGASPKPENIKIYRSKAEAENAGLRPCLRCRPDLSPQSPLWEGTGAVVSRALRYINMEQQGSLSVVADKLGITDRHLRRLFDEHLGASPMDVLLSDRLHTARALLSETQLSITEIAFASGFNSIRRFNDAFKKKYKKQPKEFRSKKQTQTTDLVVHLNYFAPYDWDGIFTFLKRHCVYGTESIHGEEFHRFLKVNSRLVKVRVKNAKESLEVSIENCKVADLRYVIKKVRSVFDIDHNPHILMQNKLKGRQKWIGTRIPGSFDIFETMITIILGQLVSTEMAQKKVQRLVQLYGQKISADCTLFPMPQALVKADFSTIGMTRVRESAIKEICQFAIQGKLERLTAQDLLNIRGIGPWTVEMIRMRCFGEVDAYPSTDLIVQRAEQAFKINPEKWSPWRAYLALWIWRRYAKELSYKRGQNEKIL